YLVGDPPMPRHLLFFGALLPLMCPGVLPAQTPAAEANKRAQMQAQMQLEFIKANYTKYEYRIPMRDGKRLFTAAYVPKDLDQKHPILLRRTPYSLKPYGADQYPAELGPSPLFIKQRYIFAYQDVRGRWMSEGEFVNMRPISHHKDKTAVDEST